MTNEELIREARRLEGDFSDVNEVVSVMSALADALEAATTDWEYGYRGDTLIAVYPSRSRESAEVFVADLTAYWAKQGKQFEVVRRRKAGVWVPVQGENE